MAAKKQNYWLVKSEPDVFSFEDLLKSKNRTTHWEGVRNYQARNFMRDEMKLGDLVFFYHSNTDVPSIMGICEVVKEGYADHFALDKKSPYFDSKADAKGVSPWVMVDVMAVKKMQTPVSRQAMMDQTELGDMLLLKRGTRLSVMPISTPHWKTICKMGSPKTV